ncbi:hypothetical protein EUX98_g939 [Antrodiella citrinella]|uniref:Glycoside hydrolase family 44 catalytic domain-containing protein n=1 Tax=Antrodiella citrinella TaxID=2447956 RepID=A0A4S4NBH6_9APHY|nr:hypothetical protein EUX98_g939 [Antrodiella citrinella]
MLSLSLLVLLSLATWGAADQIIYTDDALSNGWQDWSWGSTLNYSATNIKEDASSLFVNSTAWAALSLKSSGTIQGFAGLRFDIAGDNPPIQFYIQSTTDNDQSVTIPLTTLGTSVNSSAFTSLLLDFSALPPAGGPLALGDGAVYNIDNIILVDSITVTPQFLSAEPIGVNVIAVTGQGDIDYSSVQVKLNGKSINITSIETVPTVDVSSSLVITTDTAGNETSFSYTIPAATSGSINQHVSFPINERIYGVNFPTDADYISHLGVTISRKGGNAETAYNPFGDFTNAGNDWYFENRAADDADEWLEWVQGADSQAILLIPALDWVSKDATSYSYPKTVYSDQAAFDPYNADAGNGKFANGSWVTPPDPSLVYAPWNVSAAREYLTGLVNKPQVVTIDNEIEIASNTHQDMHPIPFGYDEILERVLNFSTMAKEVLPTVEVAAPSTCAWWYYWTSVVGEPDKVAHNGSDFLPWFLQQMAAHEETTKQRLLDTLDIHYYYAADTSSNNDSAKALRLRLSRSLWDPTYIDESWISGPASNSQPNPDRVMLIPRMQTLIQENYPGTKLSIGEFSSTEDTDLTGGLLTVDMLGIFGQHKLDQATYWETPDEKGPIGLAYWLFRGYGTLFGSNSAQVSIPSLNPDLLGVYAGTNAQHNNATLVVVNKDPDSPVALHLAGLPAGHYFLRHFARFIWVYFLRSSDIRKYSHGPAPPYALVTGASDGIGKAVARELYDQGFNLIIHGRREEKTRKVAEELRARGTRDVKYFLASVGDDGLDIPKLLEPFKDLNITFVVNNVGGGSNEAGRIDEYTEADLLRDIRINMLFAFNFTRALLPILRRSSPAQVLFIGSQSAEIRIPRLATYSPPKAFLKQLTRCLSCDERWWTPSNVSFVYVTVGTVVTNAMRTTPHIFNPTSERFAKALVARVGCAEDEYTAWAPHVLQMWSMKLLGDSFIEVYAASTIKEIIETRAKYFDEDKKTA